MVATASVRRVRATTRLQLPKACPVRVVALRANAPVVRAPRPVQAVPVLLPVPVARVRVPRVPALRVRVPRVPAVALVETVLLRA